MAILVFTIPLLDFKVNDKHGEKLYEELLKGLSMDKSPFVDYEAGFVILINSGPDMAGIIYRT